MLRGEIWWAIWPNDQSKKKRPVLIVSNDHKNSNPKLLDIVVVKITGLYRDNNTKKSVNANEDVVVTLKKDSIIRCGSIFTIEKTSLDSKAVARGAVIMKQVDEKLKTVLSL